jgi:heat-inducible transcriptional repressor
MSLPALSERTARILATLVREYIATGEPVGSLALTKRGNLGLSSATIRNVLARLEEDGYVQQPHTSAGRVPTDRAYRFYVDQLLESPRSVRNLDAVEARLRQDGGMPPLMDHMLTNVSHLLSEFSHLVGFALPAANDGAVFQQIEFLALTASKVLVVVVSRGGQVTEKVVDLTETFRPEELHQAANYLNREFSGLTIRQVREAVLQRLNEERTLYDALLARALILARSSFDEPSKTSLFVDGASSLVDDAVQHADPIALTTLRALLEMMEEKQRLIDILNEYIDGSGLTVVIGAEHTTPDLRPFSVIAATYVNGEGTGTVGVIGPTRMRYSRAIVAVSGVARALSRMLNGETN